MLDLYQSGSIPTAALSLREQRWQGPNEARPNQSNHQRGDRPYYAAQFQHF